jgi:acetyl-CoA carboxylase biotin carboxylase subunit/3-methylcrotonyl-CoA carboxylase alpha subunit
MFTKILVAHHGESALRVARTCERIGIATIAIHAEADAGAAHVSACDAAVCIGGEPHGAYQDAQAIIAAAKAQGADAVHPAAGPLARDPSFARALAQNGLAFVGAPFEALERFADVHGSRALACQAGVRALPSTRIDPNDRANAQAQAIEVGLPLRALELGLQATLIEDSYELDATLERALRRGLPALTLEHALDRPRILSVHVAVDGSGTCVALADLEHSVSMPPYGLIDESPAPALTGLANAAHKRQTLCGAAMAVALEGGLIGLGTVEFLLDSASRLYFVRLLSGLPLEHALTEICSGIDLVEAQLQIAAGETLPAALLHAQPSGHALQARVYALGESAPSADTRATVSALRWPVMPPGTLRVDSELVAGSIAAVDRDPVLAKVITYGQTRHQALLTLDRVLAEATIEPVKTNVDQLREVLADESYRAGQYDVDLLARLFPSQPA